MQFPRTYHVYLILTVLTIQANPAISLHCHECPSRGHRGSCPDNILGDPMQCFPGEVCAKDTILFFIPYTYRNMTFTQIVPRVTRKCVKYIPGLTMGDLKLCVWRDSMSPPFPGTRCLCNDTDFCNGKGKNSPADDLWLVVPTCLFFVTLATFVLLKIWQ